MDTTPDTDTTAPPATNDDGVAMMGDYPLNHRLRAEALAAAGKTTDPDELIADDLIAATADRVAREEAAQAEAAREAPSMAWTKDALTAEAARLGVAIETDANKAAILDAILAHKEA